MNNNDPDTYKRGGYAWAGIIPGAVNMGISFVILALGFLVAGLFGIPS